MNRLSIAKQIKVYESKTSARAIVAFLYFELRLLVVFFSIFFQEWFMMKPATAHHTIIASFHVHVSNDQWAGGVSISLSYFKVILKNGMNWICNFPILERMLFCFVSRWVRSTKVKIHFCFDFEKNQTSYNTI